MTARELREAGKLWPQTLTNLELVNEIRACSPHLEPISNTMLCDEYKRRIEKGIITP